jgi:hypothetical protein
MLQSIDLSRPEHTRNANQASIERHLIDRNERDESAIVAGDEVNDPRRGIA